MAVDNIGTSIADGDLCLMAGRVRAIDGDTLVIVTADGKHAFRVKSTDTRKVDTVVDPADVDAIDSGVSGKQPLSANLTALAGLSGAADKIPKFTGAGALTLIDLSTLVQAAAGAFTTTAPTSAVAASGANDLVRKNEVDGVVAILAGLILAKQDLSAVLTALASLAPSSGKVPYFTSPTTAAMVDLSSLGGGGASHFTASIAFAAGETVARQTISNGSITSTSSIVGTVHRPSATAEADVGLIYMANVVSKGAGTFDLIVVRADHGLLDAAEWAPSETVEFTYTVGSI